MGETEFCRMQRLPMKLQFLQYLGVRLSSTTVNWVPKQRMTDRSHMDADLVSPPGLEPAFNQGCVF